MAAKRVYLLLVRQKAGAGVLLQEAPTVLLRAPLLLSMAEFVHCGEDA